jgi:hypothetical protein
MERKRDDALFDSCQLCFASVTSFFLIEFRFLWNCNKSTACTSKQHSRFLSHDGFHRGT